MNYINIRLFVFLLSLICSSVCNAKTSDKPNVVFIAIDDLNDYIGCMGGALKAYTPNIDKLANKGVLFTNAHCQAPICGPSRACVMTGLLPSTSGNYLQLKDTDIKKSNTTVRKATFMPDFFEENGYKTLAVGKIYHNGDNAKSFDEYGGEFTWFGPKPEKRLKYDPKKLGKPGNTLTDWGEFPEHDSLMSDYKYAEWALEKLKESHDKPFFLAVGMLTPHVPWHVPQKWFDLYPLENIKLPPYKEDDHNDIPEMSKRVNEAPVMPTTKELIEWEEWRNMVQAYLACISFVDAQIGKVLDALEQSQYAENTIVVLWSDHGYHLGEKNRVAKQSLWERSTRTVLIFKDVKENYTSQVINEPVQLVDIYPTLLELCGLPEYKMAEGHSLAKLMKEGKPKWKHHALSFYGEGNIAVRDKQYRLIQYEDGSLEFYDMENDPNEWNNLAKKPEYKKEIKAMQKSIPKHWSPLSLYSYYNFNEYFKKITGKR